MAKPYTKCGKCGDTVWQRNRWGQISYPYHKPANPRSAAQQVVRGNFAVVSARWRLLTELQRLAWCVAAKSRWTRRRLGRRSPMKGYNFFVQVNVYLANRGLAQVDLPPGEFPPPGASPALTFYRLSFEKRGLLPASFQTLPKYPGLPPPASG